jgi:hypothetical protein
MEKKTAYVEFNSSATTATVIFSDGTKSKPYASTFEVLNALPLFIKERKLNGKQSDTIKEALAAEKRFPIGDNKDMELLTFLTSGSSIEVHEGLYFGPTSSLGTEDVVYEMMRTQLFYALFSDIVDNETQIDEPLFRICNCGNHAMIVFKNDTRGWITSGIIVSKKFGLDSIDEYKKENSLNLSYEITLQNQITDSPLPIE